MSAGRPDQDRVLLPLAPVPTARDTARGEPAPGNAVLDARGVTMRFGGLTAVRDVDLTVSSGEIVGLIGPNGAGKTTFFNCLTGLYIPTEGEVRYKGKLLPPKSFKVTAAGIARTFQNIRLFANMTVLENVLVGRHTRTKEGFWSAVLRGPGFHKAEAASRERATELLEFVGLADKADHLARNLPYGEQRKLEIARALASEPGLLLLEEVEGEHARRGQQDRQRVLHDVAGRGGLGLFDLADHLFRRAARPAAVIRWHAGRDSTPHPAVLETAALPIE